MDPKIILSTVILIVFELLIPFGIFQIDNQIANAICATKVGHQLVLSNLYRFGILTLSTLLITHSIARGKQYSINSGLRLVFSMKRDNPANNPPTIPNHGGSSLTKLRPTQILYLILKIYVAKKVAETMVFHDFFFKNSSGVFKIDFGSNSNVGTKWTGTYIFAARSSAANQSLTAWRKQDGSECHDGQHSTNGSPADRYIAPDGDRNTF